MPQVEGHGTHRLRRHYSRDLRQRIIYQHTTLRMSTSQIATTLDMPRRVVQRTLQVWREVGDVVRNPRILNRAALMDPQHVGVSDHLLHVCS